MTKSNKWTTSYELYGEKTFKHPSLDEYKPSTTLGTQSKHWENNRHPLKMKYFKWVWKMCASDGLLCYYTVCEKSLIQLFVASVEVVVWLQLVPLGADYKWSKTDAKPSRKYVILNSG